METNESIQNFVFESREVYDLAKKDEELIRQLAKKTDFSDAKTALKVYNKLVVDKIFNTVVGYSFLAELRKVILKSGLVEANMLEDIPVKEVQKAEQDTMPERPLHGDRYQRMYEGQKVLNKKLKIALTAVIIMLLGFAIINLRFEYSIFTYFTDYKANMEEELIDKYETWQSELEHREQQLQEQEQEQPIADGEEKE